MDGSSIGIDGSGAGSEPNLQRVTVGVEHSKMANAAAF